MSKKQRPYVLRARGEQMAKTRERIVAATVGLHEEIGPRRTTISAIAERAGVERLTVYRHFPDEGAIYRACSACWLERNPPPDPATWRDVTDPAERMRKTLQLLYAYYSRTQAMLAHVLHDAKEMPLLAEAAEGLIAYMRSIADDLLAAWKSGSSVRPGLAAVLHHSVQFATWASLEAERVADVAKARLMVLWAESIVAQG